MGYSSCPKCSGKGEVKCPKCGGSAFAHSIKSATDKAFGLKPDDPCTRCDDNFVVACNECGGTGKVKENLKYVEAQNEEEDDDDDDSNDYDSNGEYSSSHTSSTGNISNSSSEFIYPVVGFCVGFFISCVVGFFKGCGLFYYEPQKGNAYLFDIDDAGKGFWVIPLVGAAIGLIGTIISLASSKKN